IGRVGLADPCHFKPLDNSKSAAESTAVTSAVNAVYEGVDSRRGPVDHPRHATWLRRETAGCSGTI
ncbi:MAG: hypothetical protein ACLPZR_32585, partial [Solirubrobacteraceae bacterium]